MQDILEKIKSTGYWKVILRPKEFHNELITPLSLCKNYLESSAVTLRGWSYPHIESHLISNGQDWVEHHTDYTDRPEFGYVEFVRLYQSGQFYHLFACREDYSVSTDEIPSRSVKTTSPTNKYLSILATLYTITEIYFFASKLFKHLDTDGISVDISLNDSVGRQLFFYDKSRYLRRDYRCTIPSGIKIKTV